MPSFGGAQGAIRYDIEPCWVIDASMHTGTVYLRGGGGVADKFYLDLGKK